MAVLLLWSVMFPAPERQRSVPVEREGTPSQEIVGLQEASRDESSRDRAMPETTRAPAAPDRLVPEDAGSLLGVISGSGPRLKLSGEEPGAGRETVRLENEELSLEIDGQGARLVEARLRRFEEEPGEPVQLIPEGGPGALGSVLVLQGQEISLDRFNFRLAQQDETAGGRRIVWELPLEEVILRKAFIVPREGNLIQVEHEIVEDRVGISAWGLSWAGGLRVTEGPKAGGQRGPYFQGAVLAEGEVQRKNPKDAWKEPLEYPGHAYFVTSQNKYFLAAIVPREEGQGPAKLWRVTPAGTEDHTMGAEILAERSPGGLGATRVVYDVYIGPQDYAGIKALGLGIENAMDLGMKWVRPLSRTVLAFLIWLHRFIPNYGFVIVLFAAAVNLVFFPLTFKSTKSMRDMAALKPQLDALKQKYKNDQQKMSEATMKLYKEAGVNPLGGCLPILLQMPIFFALYAVLFRTIELRQEPFILWIRDLSQPDVIFHLPFAIPFIGTGVAALPIIMGVTSFLQSKMTMADPNQKAMVYLMPVMMTVIFFSFPSGLVLYWLTSNLFTISTKLFMKAPPTPAPAS
jgi:YidC/Oxa1 family membrane protein insertase